MWNRKEDLFDVAPRGLIDELRRRGYDVDDKSSTEIVRLIMEGELMKRSPVRLTMARRNREVNSGHRMVNRNLRLISAREEPIKSSRPRA